MIRYSRHLVFLSHIRVLTGLIYISQTDASEGGVGAFLTLSDDSGQEHPVSYYSTKQFPK